MIEEPIVQEDYRLFGKELGKRLEEHLPFDSLSFLMARSSHPIALFNGVEISSRQRDRAVDAIGRDEPFWDRVHHQLFIPMECSEKGILTVAHLKNIPKNTGAEEGKWLSGLISFFLVNTLRELKRQSLVRQDGCLPEYIVRLCASEGAKERQLLFLNASPKYFPEIEVIHALIEPIWSGHGLLPLGLSNGSMWFMCHGNYSDMSSLHGNLKKTSNLLIKKNIPVEALYLLDIKDKNRLKRLFHIAKAFKARVFSYGFIEAIEEETGLDIFSLTDMDLPARDFEISGLIKVSSAKYEERIADWLNRRGFGPIRLDNGFLFMTISEAELDEGSIQDFFASILGMDSRAIAGFSNKKMRKSANDTTIATFLAFYHAWMLGAGKMAIYDSVTCNVHGDLLLGLGDIKGAVAAYRAGLRLKGDDVNLLNSLGTLLAELGRLSDAKECFLKVHEKDPDNPMASYNISGIFLRKKLLKDALGYIENAIEHQGDEPAFLARKLDILLKMHEHIKAAEFAKGVLDKIDDTAPISLLFLCAKALFFNGDWQNAKALLKSVFDKNPRYSSALLYLSYGFWQFEGDEGTACRLMKNIDFAKIVDKDERKMFARLVDCCNP